MTYFRLQVEEYTVSLYFGVSLPQRLLTEARDRGINLTGPYSYLKHSPHIPQGQQHLHIYRKSNQLFSINRDGSAHDKNHGFRIPNKVVDALKTAFPDWIIPKDQMIESASGDLTQIIVEIYLRMS